MGRQQENRPIVQFDIRANLRAAYDWIERSRSPRTGGSRAYYAPVVGWSPTYPGGTGYLIPTVIRAGELLGDPSALERARGFGEFLVDIQRPEGGWLGLTWPPRRGAQLSVFNTAGILEGLCALARATDDEEWLQAASRGARWLAAGVDEDGNWRDGGYMGSSNPTYYSHAAWPMLEVWSLTGDREVRDAALRVLDNLIARRTILGAFRGWGFGGSDTAFTHTIGYAIRGFLESARITGNWDRYAKPTLTALRRIAEDAIISRGRLAGTYDADWRTESSFSCLSGNAQIALCLSLAAERAQDPRFPQAARILTEAVCRRQALDHPVPGVRGAVAGSQPVLGRYMRGRYPSWAAKYLCDSIVALLEDAAAPRMEEPARLARR